MQILINGENKQFGDPLSLSALIEALDLTGKRIAVEVNEELVPRSEHGACQLQEGDRVEIVQAIGGG